MTFTDVYVPGDLDARVIKTIVVDGLTLELETISGDIGPFPYTAQQIASVLTGGHVDGIRVSGELQNYTAVATDDVVVFTAKVQSPAPAAITVTGDAYATAPEIVTVSATNSVLTAEDVATALATGTMGSGLAGVVTNDNFGYSGAVDGLVTTQVNLSAATEGAKALLTSVTSVGVTAPQIFEVAAGAEVVDATHETALITFTALNSGEALTVAGRTVTASGGSLTAEQVAGAYLSGMSTGFAHISGGTIDGWTVQQSGQAGDATLLMTSTATGNIANIDAAGYAISAATASSAPVVQVTDGSAGSYSSVLHLTDFAQNGKLEVMGAVDGMVEVTMKSPGDTGTLNVDFAGNSYSESHGVLKVAGVGTLNIHTSDASWIPTGNNLVIQGDTVNSVVVTGTHGLNLFTSALSNNMDQLDASAVTGQDQTGAIYFQAVNQQKAIHILTGAGDDVLIGSSFSDTIHTGTGHDTVYSSNGADQITFGSENSSYFLIAANHSQGISGDTIHGFGAESKLTINSALMGMMVPVNVGVFSDETQVNNFLSTNAGQVNLALNSDTGALSIDLNGDGTVDSTILLSGVTTFAASQVQFDTAPSF